MLTSCLVGVANLTYSAGAEYVLGRVAGATTSVARLLLTIDALDQVGQTSP